MKMARIGIYLDQRIAERNNRYHVNVFQKYIEEILTYAGIPTEWLNASIDLVGSGCDLIIAALTGSQQAEEALWEYALQGGVVISYGGLPYLAARLGCRPASEIPIGYARLQSPGADPRPLRFFNARPWTKAEENEALVKQQGALAAMRPDGVESGYAQQVFRVGKGWIVRWAIDIPSVIVRLQQGEKPVTEDGIPAEDGTAALDEGILKADDQCQMDWEYDRLFTETGMPYFAHPYADLWKEAVIGDLLVIAAERNIMIPFLDYWPEGIDCVAMISHDSDFNSNESAETTLDVLDACGVHSTWCMIEPGFRDDLYPRLIEAGHEIALHYNALEQEKGIWSQEEFRRQLDALKASSGVEHIVSNKNHYTRYEGWGDLFRWCESAGIESDQTRGPSKKGNVGFLFGTCHPYFPIAWANEGNRLYNVLEIGFLTQDLNHPTLSDTSVIVPFLERVKEVRGVAHFLFHQIHIHRLEEVREAIKQVAAVAKKMGYVFWTGERINEWVRRKRDLVMCGLDADGSLLLEGESLPVAAYRPLTANERGSGTVAVMRFGVPCVKMNVKQVEPSPKISSAK